MREVNSLAVKCPNEGTGCLWKGELGMVESHMSAGPRARDGGCGYVEVECVYRCGRFFQRHLLREHEEEICPNCPVEVQMSSSLRKIKEVTEENEQLKMD